MGKAHVLLNHTTIIGCAILVCVFLYVSNQSNHAHNKGERPTTNNQRRCKHQARILDSADLLEAVDSRKWFHTIDFGNGVTSEGYDPTPTKLSQLDLNVSFAEKTVLDIGAYDGGLSVYAARHGARRVVAADYFMWSRMPNHFDNICFVISQFEFEKTIVTKWIAVEDVSIKTLDEKFDVVLFLGVLYHSPDPIGYLERVRSVTREVAVIETVVDMLHIPLPVLAFYHGATSLNGDNTNYFGPNEIAMEAMILKAGFSRVVRGERWADNLAHNLQAPSVAVKKPQNEVSSGRTVFYAYP